MKSLRIALFQKPLGTAVSRRDMDGMRQFRPHFICFPEYFFVNRRLGNQGQTLHNQKRQLQRIEVISRELETVVIGGTMPEKSGDALYNTSFVFDRGKLLGWYRKKHLFFPEVGTITPGDSYTLFSACGITFGVLICADIFHDSAFEFMRKGGARIIFSPTFSLKKNETVEEKYKRDNDIYVRGAALSGAVIVKVCGVKSDYKDFLQARSLIAAPEGILYRVRPDEEDKPMVIMKEVVLT